MSDQTPQSQPVDEPLAQPQSDQPIAEPIEGADAAAVPAQDAVVAPAQGLADSQIAVSVGDKSSSSQLSQPQALKQVVSAQVGDRVDLDAAKQQPVDPQEAEVWKSLSVGQTIRVKVVAVNTGGLELRLAKRRLFMPRAQIDLSLVPVEKMPEYIQQELDVKVLEINRKQRSAVVSRRALLKRELLKQATQQINENYKVGQLVEGKVSRVTEQGVFVEFLPGFSGLIKPSELAWGYVAEPQKAFAKKQPVKAKITAIRQGGRQVDLSIRQTLPNPWESLDQEVIAVGKDLEGVVTRLAESAAFVQVTEAGIEGRIHISQLVANGRVDRVEQAAQVGKKLKARVISLDVKKGRLALSVKALTAPMGDRTAQANRNDMRPFLKTNDNKAKIGTGLLDGIDLGDLSS